MLRACKAPGTGLGWRVPPQSTRTHPRAEHGSAWGRWRRPLGAAPHGRQGPSENLPSAALPTRSKKLPKISGPETQHFGFLWSLRETGRGQRPWLQTRVDTSCSLDTPSPSPQGLQGPSAVYTACGPYLCSPRTARAPKYLFSSVSGFKCLEN